MRHGYPINHFFLMGGSVMSIDVVPLEVDLSKELNEVEKRDEAMKEKCRYLSEFIRYIILNFIVITAVKTKTKRINYFNANIF